MERMIISAQTECQNTTVSAPKNSLLRGYAEKYGFGGEVYRFKNGDEWIGNGEPMELRRGNGLPT